MPELRGKQATEDVKDETVKGTKAATKKTVKVTKKAGNEVGDKAEDAKDETVKGSKDVAGFFKRAWKKVF